jgi:acyl-CoA dehydrogenase
MVPNEGSFIKNPADYSTLCHQTRCNSATQSMIRDADTLNELLTAVTRFVREELVPLEARVAAEDAVPSDIARQMRDLGLFGLSIPVEYGGIGLTMEEEIHVAMALGGASPAFRSVFSTNVGIGSQGLLMDGTAEQKARYLPRLAKGDLVASFALTEPDAGSDAASIRTRATRVGDYYVLNGTKRYITNAPVAGLFTVYARTGPDELGARGISAFLVESKAAGLRVGKPEKKMGQQGSPVADVIFEDCHVPTQALLGGVEGRGFTTAMKVLDRGRLHLAGLAVGVAERLLGMMTAYATERCQFGHPIADFQLIQAMLADSYTECYAARCMVIDAAQRRDNNERLVKNVAAAKYFATEMVGRVADRAVQLYGGAGYIAEYGVERIYRDVRLFRIYEGTSQIQQLVIAKELLRDQAQSQGTPH